jgi:hypothetical protein
VLRIVEQHYFLLFNICLENRPIKIKKKMWMERGKIVHNGSSIMKNEFSDYIVYVDESGDHSLEVVYDDHPIFVLAFCVFQKNEYAHQVAPALCSLKFDFWGHDSLIFHSHKIRKQTEEFAILANLPSMTRFMGKLSEIIQASPFTIISTIIDKRKLKTRYADSKNPYHLGLLFCLERLSSFLKEKNQKDKTTYLVMEARGKKEDSELELEFRRIMDKARSNGLAKFEIQFADKRANSIGLQIADLVAHPIGRQYINPSQPNRSFEILERKLHKFPHYRGKGLKVFP